MHVKLQFNRKIRSKSQQYFFYEDWCDKGFIYVNDLLNPSLPGFKLKNEFLILTFLVETDKNIIFLMKNLPGFIWLDNPNSEIYLTVVFDRN